MNPYDSSLLLWLAVYIILCPKSDRHDILTCHQPGKPVTGGPTVHKSRPLKNDSNQYCRFHTKNEITWVSDGWCWCLSNPSFLQWIKLARSWRCTLSVDPTLYQLTQAVKCGGFQTTFTFQHIKLVVKRVLQIIYVCMCMSTSYACITYHIYI